jgi:CRP-like cAMP-binding protein
MARRLDGAFALLAIVRRHNPDSVAVIARALADPARTASRANAHEALESLAGPRLTRLLARAAAPGDKDLADSTALAELARTEWALAPLDRAGAYEALWANVHDGSWAGDRWLAAIAIVAAADEIPNDGGIAGIEIDAPRLAAWTANPDPTIREAARYIARRQNLEIDMEDTGSVPPVLALSAVERAIFLKQVPFFADMSVDQLRTLAGIAEEHHFDEGDVVVAAGEPGDALYVVVTGRVGIEREPKEGRVQRLDTLATRQYFGDRTIFDGAPHDNRAVALDRVHLLAIRRRPLLALLRRAPDLSLSLVTLLSSRLREADDRLARRTRAKPDQVMRLYDRLTGEE